MSGAGVYEQIKDDLGYLQLDRAAEVFATLADQARTDGLTHIEFLARLVGEQADATRNRRLAARLRFARFPFRKTIDQFDFAFQPTVDRRLVEDLATLRFMETGRPVLFLGQPGCGKTHLAVALATLAVEAGFRGYFTNAEEMAASIAQATREGTLAAKLKTYTAPSVLVIDDVGLLPLDRAGASAFYQVVNLRYEKQHLTPLSPQRSSTGSCTTPSCSTSKALPGAYESTKPSPPPPQTPPPGDGANLQPQETTRPHDRDFR